MEEGGWGWGGGRNTRCFHDRLSTNVNVIVVVRLDLNVITIGDILIEVISKEISLGVVTWEYSKRLNVNTTTHTPRGSEIK